MNVPDASSDSPTWGPTIKLIVGLSFVGIFAALLVRFRNIIGPLLLALILAYILHPVTSWINEKTRLSWRTSVNMIFLLFVILLLGFFTITGFATVQQAQSLVRVVNRFVTDLPQIATDISTQRYQIGPFLIDMNLFLGQYDINSLVNQILGIIQPVLGRAGGLVSALASGTLSTLGWGFFILLISYFTLADAGRVPDMVAGIEIPGYSEDIRRLGRELGWIWNVFMRGQVILFTASAVSAFILMSVLGVRNALVLALLAGVARFVPYAGPFITWTVTGLVAFFQSSNYFNLEPFTYMLVVVIALLLLDQIFDNLVTPRLYGSALGLHPAAVLVSAIIAANLIGFVGLLLASPVLATLKLFGRYALRKMLDLDPWPEQESEERVQFPGVRAVLRLWSRLRERINQRSQNEGKTT